MKLALIVFSGVALAGLILFNYYQFSSMKGVVVMMDELVVDLNLRGRQRYEIQSFFTELTNTKDQDKADAAINQFREHRFFGSYQLISENAELLKNWNGYEGLLVNRDTLASLKRQYLLDFLFSPADGEAINHDNSTIFDSMRVWKEEVIGTLDKIQESNVRLFNYLTSRMSHILRTSVYLNTVLVSSMLLAITGFIMLNQHEHRRQGLAAMQTLEKRQNELLTSKNVLLSLMEDVVSERTLALQTSDKLAIANEMLQQRNAELEQFVCTVSHDLKSPLVTIAGFTRILRQEIDEKLTEKQRYRLARIESNVNEMENLLSDLLNLSRVIHDEINPVVLDTEYKITQLCSALDVQLQHAQANVIIDSPLLHLFANERLFSQCLSNLVNNAINYRNVEKPLELRFSTTRQDGYDLLAVADNGIGIDEKYHQRIFRIFERLDIGEGTGVGLTIVKSVMEKHGGRVALKSSIGEGSTFTLYFPRAPEQYNAHG